MNRGKKKNKEILIQYKINLIKKKSHWNCAREDIGTALKQYEKKHVKC